jgi:uncharacterized membrane protein
MLQITKTKATLDTTLPFVLITAGMVGLIASFVLTYDKIHVLTDAGYKPSCNLNPVLSCGSVMQTEQASLLGIPNTIFGLVAFAMLLTFGLLLASGATARKWLWIGAQLAATVGVVFMHYLFFQGVFRIQAICPWCFAVWMVTIPVFWYITLYNLQERHIRLPKWTAGAVSWAQRHHGDILALWYLVILGILVQHFWYYWSTLLF